MSNVKHWNVSNTFNVKNVLYLQLLFYFYTSSTLSFFLCKWLRKSIHYTPNEVALRVENLSLSISISLPLIIFLSFFSLTTYLSKYLSIYLSKYLYLFLSIFFHSLSLLHTQHTHATRIHSFPPFLQIFISVLSNNSLCSSSFNEISLPQTNSLWCERKLFDKLSDI